MDWTDQSQKCAARESVVRRAFFRVFDPLLFSRSCSRRKSVFSRTAHRCESFFSVYLQDRKAALIASAACPPVLSNQAHFFSESCLLTPPWVCFPEGAQARSSIDRRLAPRSVGVVRPILRGRRGLDHEVCEGCSRVPFARLLRSSPTGRARHLLVPDERCPVPALRTNKRPPSRLRQT